MKNQIMTLYDFTDQANCAVNHSINYAQKDHSSILLSYVYDGGRNSQTFRFYEERLKRIADGIQQTANVLATAEVRQGNPLKTLENWIGETESKVLFLGTEKIKGFQKLYRTYTFKIVQSSKVPVFIVQKRKMNQGGYGAIMVVLNDAEITVQKIGYAISLAKLYESKIVFYISSLNNAIRSSRQTLNVEYARRIATLNNIEFTEIREDRYINSRTGNIIRIAANHGIELIVIGPSEEKSTKGYRWSSVEAKIVNNAHQIAVFCVDKKMVDVPFINLKFSEESNIAS